MGIWYGPDGPFVKFVLGKDVVEKAQGVSGKVKVESGVMEGPCGHHGVVCGIIQHGAYTHVELVHVGAGEDYVIE